MTVDYRIRSQDLFYEKTYQVRSFCVSKESITMLRNFYRRQNCDKKKVTKEHRRLLLLIIDRKIVDRNN